MSSKMVVTFVTFHERIIIIYSNYHVIRMFSTAGTARCLLRLLYYVLFEV